VRSIIAGEKDHSVAVNFEFAQFIHQPADIGIHAGDHGGFIFFDLWPWLGGVRRIGRDLHAVAGALAFLVVGMRDRVREVKKEWSEVIELVGLIDADKIQRGGREQIVAVKAFFAVVIFGQDVLSFVWVFRIKAFEMVGVIIVCVCLIEVADELIKPFLIRQAAGTSIAQPPFANEASVIACLLEDFRNCLVLWTEGRLGGVAANGSVAGVETSHQAGARGGADGAAGVALGEANAFGGEAIDVRGFDFRLAVAAQIAIAQIIGEDEDNVWPLRRGCLCLKHKRKDHQK